MTSDARAALEAGDDGFHEIQLNGKQLVFLGMATTLVSVVIFLCGVLVGRGVKPLDAIAQAGGAAPFDVPVAASVSPGTVTTPAATVATAPPPAPAATPVAAGAADAGEDDGAHPTPLDEDAPDAPPVAAAPAPAPAPAPVASAAPVKPTPPPVETRAEAKPAAKPVEAIKPTPKPAEVAAVPPAARPTPAAAMTATPPATGGKIAVQVGAFKTRGEADALAKRLSTRGYAVYVMNPNDGKAVYRVRVGNFASADEAQRISTRLTQQEKLKPWVTR